MLLTLSSVDPLLRLLELAEEGQESINQPGGVCRRMSGDNTSMVDRRRQCLRTRRLFLEGEAQR